MVGQKKWIRVAGGGMKGTPKKNAIGKKTTIKLTGAIWKSVEVIPAGRADKTEIFSSASYEQTTKDTSSNESTHEWSVDVEQNWEIFGSKGKIQGHYGGGVKSLNAKMNSMVNSTKHSKAQEFKWDASDENRQLFQLQLEGVDEAGNLHFWTSTQHRICYPLGAELPPVSTVLQNLWSKNAETLWFGSSILFNKTTKASFLLLFILVTSTQVVCLLYF